MFTNADAVSQASFSPGASHAASNGHNGARREWHPRLTRCQATHPRRREAEAFIKSGYWTSHGASVATLMPELLLLTDGAGALKGVSGIREAAIERLYLENYLDARIEVAITSAGGKSVCRCQIVEVGNFATASTQAAKQLLRVLPGALLDRGFRWAAFTATSPLRKLLSRMGGTLIELCEASADRVAGAPDLWGTYYQTKPRVLAGYLPSIEGVSRYEGRSRGD